MPTQPPAGPPPGNLPPPPPYAPPPPAPQRRRRLLPVVLAAVVAVLVVAGAVAVPLLLDGGAGETPADLSAVQVYEDLPAEHTTGDVVYPQAPPAGGPHDPAWLDCGVYDEPVREENVVHDLEHGTVWISYRPGLDRDEIDALAEVLPQNGILSPYGDQSAPVVVTVWGRQLELTGAEDPRLQLFIDRFGGGETAPEPFASCAGGVREPESGSSTNV